MEKFRGKTVLVTGSCGTVGAEVVRQLHDSPVDHVVCLDNNESELFFQIEKYRNSGKVSGFLADIRDLDALKLRMRGVNIVIHAAALKHVTLCESSPNQAVQTNIMGTQNIIDAALANDVERVLFTSSDKAVNPTNVMGTSKLMGERLMTAAAESFDSFLGRRETGRREKKTPTIFASTRFGNVLGSRGSVVPIFQRQIEEGKQITLTDKNMTRFVMTLAEATSLVLESVWLARGGEVMVPRMPVARIDDLAHVMRDVLGQGKNIPIVEIGNKPGEKLYEELINDEEVRRTYEYGEFLIVTPAFIRNVLDNYQYLTDCARTKQVYNSNVQKPLAREELKQYLISRQVI